MNFAEQLIQDIINPPEWRISGTDGKALDDAKELKALLADVDNDMDKLAKLVLDNDTFKGSQLAAVLNKDNWYYYRGCMESCYKGYTDTGCIQLVSGDNQIWISTEAGDGDFRFGIVADDFKDGVFHADWSKGSCIHGKWEVMNSFEPVTLEGSYHVLVYKGIVAFVPFA